MEKNIDEVDNHSEAVKNLYDKGLLEETNGYYHLHREKIDWIKKNMKRLRRYQLPGSHGYDESSREVKEEEKGEISDKEKERIENIVKGAELL